MSKSIKKIISLLAILMFITSTLSYANTQQSTFQSTSTIQYAPGEVLVQFRDQSQISSVATVNTIDGLLGQNQYAQKRYNRFSTMFIKSNNYSTEVLINILNQMDSIKSISPNYIRNFSVSTNDTYYSSLWAMENTGQSSGTIDADIDAKEAWDLQTGSRSVVVAVVDSGIDYTHPDLSDNMWNGSAYGAPNHGWDFAADSQGNDDNDPMPSSDHGTHVAGTIGASANNNLGVVGVSHHVSLMALQVFRPDGYGYDSDILQAMEFILDKIDLGVNVVAINASYGGGGSSEAMEDAIAELGSKGVIFCAAAGNGGRDGIGDNNDNIPYYPSSYDLDNIISIAATDRNDILVAFSNYGVNHVDIAAPGVSITSSIPNSSYATWSGTSMATPHVAGAVALLAANRLGTTVTERITTLLSTVDIIPSLNGKVATGGRLNINNALIADNSGGGGNTKPVADAGDDQDKNTGETVTLDGSGSSDAEGDPLTYQWQFNSKPTGSSATLSNTTSDHPAFTADVAGDYVVELIVKDGTEFSDPDTVTISVTDTGVDPDITTWTTGAYANYEDRSQVLSIPGASSLIVTVTGETESRYDFIYIYDQNGNQIARYDGTINTTNNPLIVQGSSITARLTSDYSVTRSGITVTIERRD